tara:strand:+ start:30 stop:239 length:210 start_codon:yes stop_codon:yes gene_type:complete
MTQEPKPRSYGHPKPITKLTLEQDLKMRVIEDGLRKNYDKKEDVITVFLALQEQNFILGNNLKELLQYL